MPQATTPTILFNVIPLIPLTCLASVKTPILQAMRLLEDCPLEGMNGMGDIFFFFSLFVMMPYICSQSSQGLDQTPNNKISPHAYDCEYADDDILVDVAAQFYLPG